MLMPVVMSSPYCAVVAFLHTTEASVRINVGGAGGAIVNFIAVIGGEVDDVAVEVSFVLLGSGGWTALFWRRAH